MLRTQRAADGWGRQARAEALRDFQSDTRYAAILSKHQEAAGRASRGWTPAELARREAAQWPLDRKRALADHVIHNDGDPASLRAQVRAVLDEVSPV